jgi:hypothetical protein
MKVVLAHGPGGLFDFFPLLFIGAAVWVIMNVLRDGQKRSRAGTTTLPRNNNPWSRQVHAATYRKRASEKPTAQPSERSSVRFGAPRSSRLRVMDGEADKNRPAVPRRFEPPPPSKRKTG